MTERVPGRLLAQACRRSSAVEAACYPFSRAGAKRRHAGGSVTPATDHLQLGRAFYARRAWADAFEALTLADGATPLATDDLERLAMSAFLTGRESEYVAALDRVHRACLDARMWARAARSAFWIGLCHLFRGEFGTATGWFGRARRTLDCHGTECAEQGYLLLPLVEQQLVAGDAEQAWALGARAAAIGDRFADPDLVACARHLQGRARLLQDRIEQGLALLDEAMVSVVADELSPRMTGLIYCSVIEKCMQVFAFPRAREWTFMLSRWCEAQPQLVAFTGRCLVHRAEILQWQGAWGDALEEVRHACAPSPAERQPPLPLAGALYRLGELHRLRGEIAAAEEAYREASAQGYEPQPGLALLRLAEGHTEAAAAAIRGALAAASNPSERLPLLQASVDIMLAAGDIDEAHRACREIEALAQSFDTGVPRAISAHARGAIALAEGEVSAALAALRQAFDLWRDAGAPYEAARARELMALACRALGDKEAAQSSLNAAIATYRELGAAPDLTRTATADCAAQRRHGLTRREMQVLRLLATGKTNKAIAAELYLSRRTVDRHVSNVLGKLGVSSRAAATAYAHRHDLLQPVP
ncbi:MAG TPA: LuxR C-terminal-related transcriptional regulator [Woeseiaceae bacterium]|nr:LuxR C-terminal-related transcriptional regulator [Woeseiaceae bacterium]